MLDVEEGQNKLAQLKNQLLLKKSQVADAKAALDHKCRSIQKITKCCPTTASTRLDTTSGVIMVFCSPLRDLEKLQREVMSAETALEQKRMARHNLLLACKIQGLPVALLSGTLNEISEVQVRSPEGDWSLEWCS